MNDKKRAGILFLLLLLIAVGCLLWIGLAGNRTASADTALTADIYQNGALLTSIRLDTVTSEYSFEVTGENGASNMICVRPGSIGITSASCPDKICVHQGFIHNSLLPITCLPNRLVIRVREDAAASTGADAITY